MPQTSDFIRWSKRKQGDDMSRLEIDHSQVFQPTIALRSPFPEWAT